MTAATRFTAFATVANKTQPSIIPVHAGIRQAVAATGLCGFAIFAIAVLAEEKSPSPPAATPVDLALPPVATYTKGCARCHGPNGAFFAKEFIASTHEALREATHRMLLGPSGLKPTPSDTDAMTAYMEAIEAKQPFAVIVNGAELAAGTATQVRGELAGKGAKLEVRAAGAIIPVTQKGKQWTLTPIPNEPIEVTAAAGETRRTFTFPTSQW